MRSSVVLLAVAVSACTQSARSARVDREPAPERAARAAVPAEPARPAAAEPSREGWNDAQIDWQPYESALALARAQGRPICLVMEADWCPHCRNYSHVFEDPRVVERAGRMVMVRVDTTEHGDLAARYELDGGYVPRTYFLSPEGEPQADIDARRARFRYFFDERDPGSLLAAMDVALDRFR